jgi:hypothetical protein
LSAAQADLRKNSPHQGSATLAQLRREQALDPDALAYGTAEMLFAEIALAAVHLGRAAALVEFHAELFDQRQCTFCARQAAAYPRALLGHVADATALAIALETEADDADE